MYHNFLCYNFRVAESKNIEERISTPPIHFNQSVSINNLPFIFEGDIPDKPSEFKWKIIAHDWQKQTQEIEQKISVGNMSRYLPLALKEFKSKEGAIGEICAEIGEKNIALSIIYTETWSLPKEFGYENIHGIGNFLLKNFLTFADIKCKPILLHPYPTTNSPLNTEKTEDWYKKNGFLLIADAQNVKLSAEGKKKFSMVRLPKKPDLSQPIASVLQTNEALA